MPHITMVYPFRPLHEFEDLSRKFEEICASFPPFRIRLVEFRYFQHSKGSYTVWLYPDPKEPIVELQRALSRVVPDCDDVGKHRKGFAPHLSVGQVRLEVGDVIRRLGETWESLEFILDEIALISRNDPPDDVFETRVKVRLGRDL